MLCIWYAAPNQPGSLSAAYRSILFNPSLLYKEKDPFNTFASGFHVKNHKITMSHLLFFFFLHRNILSFYKCMFLFHWHHQY